MPKQKESLEYKQMAKRAGEKLAETQAQIEEEQPESANKPTVMGLDILGNVVDTHIHLENLSGVLHSTSYWIGVPDEC